MKTKISVPWPGGKTLLLKTLLKCIPEHHCYVEVFAGGAKVLFGKEPSKVEVLNDIDHGLINFYQVVRDNHVEFQNRWDLLLHSKKWFDYFLKQDPDRLNAVDQAVRFWYLRKGSFARLGSYFARAKNKCEASYIGKAKETALLLHQRLSKVSIEQCDFEEIIKRYDFENAFFYLDPPYLSRSKDLYKEEMDQADFIRLKETLANLHGKFLLSHCADDFIKELFAEFHIREVQTKYTMAGGRNKSSVNKARSEFLISNYPIEV